MLVPASSVSNRAYDAYVAVWVGLPDHHLAWLTKNVPYIQKNIGNEWKKILQDLESIIENIPCRVIGYALWEDISRVISAESENDQTARSELDKIFGERGWKYLHKYETLYDPNDPSWKGTTLRRDNIGFVLSRLRGARDTNQWSEFKDYLLQNEKHVPPITRKSFRGVPEECRLKTIRDVRELFQRCMEKQLFYMQRRFGSIRRTTSWFRQPLE